LVEHKITSITPGLIRLLVRSFVRFLEKQMVGVAMVLEPDFAPVTDRVGVLSEHRFEIAHRNHLVVIVVFAHDRSARDPIGFGFSGDYNNAVIDPLPA
jgi:hypothetical protein